MYYVSWEEAKEFCTRLSRQTGRNYSLPTEAEWEYAARGGNKSEGTKYSGGWGIDDVAWYAGNSGNSTHACGTKRPNALGIYDMSGNVWEWCEDWYGKSYIQYDNDNPKGASTGSRRVLRGGSWYNNAGYCRVSFRGSYGPSDRDYDFGFRVVLH
jgi:formylglycine-generating enzyme required for sulfatase activity